MESDPIDSSSGSTQIERLESYNMNELETVESQLQQLDIKAKELLKKLRVAIDENDISVAVNELNDVALRASNLAYGNGGLDWLSERLEMLIWKTDHLDEPGAVEQLVENVRSGAFQ